MQSEIFDELVAAQLRECQRTLSLKADEYAEDTDRLHNFRVSASLQGISMEQALGGMMAKHTISVYDMIYSEHAHPYALWHEKITDHINYLLILHAMVAGAEHPGAEPLLKDI